MFETFDDDQIAALASILGLHKLKDKQVLTTQGEDGIHMYILDSGEMVATVSNGGVEQEVKRYQSGEFFGETAFIKRGVRAATIKAVGDGVRVWALSREGFEAKLGPLSQLKAEQYLADPRHLIADFYRKGDSRGPAGVVAMLGGGEASSEPSAQTSWFAVYRPCSRDSIAKMVSRVGTGKGLNIKGKSAKKNRLSGFVPFCQISNNEDKALLGPTPSGARSRIFYHSHAACGVAQAAFESALVELQVEKGAQRRDSNQRLSPPITELYFVRLYPANLMFDSRLLSQGASCRLTTRRYTR